MVLEGRARLKVGEREHTIGPGHVLFVRATTAHSFFDIEEDLTVLAFFGARNAR
ncbi:MAG: cupin domain-containing protein [Gammaproteobacteria bacterium]